MNDELQTLDAEEGRLLLRLARSALMEKLGRRLPAGEAERLQSDLKSPRLRMRRGTFVTLTLAGNLRGCIGNLFPTDSLVEGIRRNAVHAAFQDPRFNPLAEVELDQVEIEVSVLTEPQPLSYSAPLDLLQKLRPHVDGVIVRQGYASATFLPQVWDQLPNAEDFLGHLCLKAGLPRDAWKRSRLDVATYRVQRFEEQPT
jgi:AmmeMemoRadiSam system protein A